MLSAAMLNTTSKGPVTAAVDGSPGLVSRALWNNDTVLRLKDLTGSQSVPGLIKVVRGQYRNIGVEKGCHNLLYVHSVQTSQKVLTDGFKVSDTNAFTPVIVCRLSLLGLQSLY